MGDAETTEISEITPPTAVRIGEGPIGRGVFAARDIASGEAIEVCPIIEIDESDASGQLGDYVVHSNSDPERIVFMFGYGSLYNHSAEPAAEYVQTDEFSFTFNAVRDIREGEEITIDYGDEWWGTREQEPG